MSFYHFENSRTEEQTAEMRRLDAAGICLFCPGHLEGVQEVLHRSEHWAVTPNRFPYSNAGLHLLLVPHTHVTDMVELTPEAQADFFSTLAWVREKFDLTYYGLGVRSGDSPVTGSTIKHLHVHVIVGDLDREPVRFKMSSPPR
jgi:ATP adenylyltransferase